MNNIENEEALVAALRAAAAARGIPLEWILEGRHGDDDDDSEEEEIDYPFGELPTSLVRKSVIIS